MITTDTERNDSNPASASYFSISEWFMLWSDQFGREKPTVSTIESYNIFRLKAADNDGKNQSTSTDIQWKILFQVGCISHIRNLGDCPRCFSYNTN